MAPQTSPRSGQRPRIFPTVEAFNEGYAGASTKLLEKKSRDLAGRQDDFCIICGEKPEELFPQKNPEEIHLCPRQFCSRCWHIEAGWKRNSLTKRRSLKVNDGRTHLPICCPFCWKRGWDYSNPLLGADQPEWTDWHNEIELRPKEEALQLRHQFWEEAAAKKKIFSWRLPLLTHKDDMTLESDRDLLRVMLKSYQKNPKRFNLFDAESVEEATAEKELFAGEAFDVDGAFLDAWKHLTSADESSDEVSPVQVKRGPGRPKRKSRPPGWYIVEEPIEPPEDTPVAGRSAPSATPETGGRPKRQAARLSFASGKPVQRTRVESSNDGDEVISPPRVLKSRASKIITLPTSLPSSPETKKSDVATPNPRHARVESVESSHSLQPVTEPAVQVDAEDTGEKEEPRPSQHNPTQTMQKEATVEGPTTMSLDEVDDVAQTQGPKGNNAGQQIPQVSIAQNVAPVQPAYSALANGNYDQTNAVILELQQKYATLSEEHNVLDARYRRWRTGAVENSKLIFDQEEDLAEKKDIITGLHQNIRQLSSDNARLGAELALARGMVQYNPGLLKQTLLRSSLTPDVVERLFNNPDFIELLQPRPANGEVITPQQPQPTNPDSARPRKRRRITAADAANDAEADEARQKKLTRVIAPTIKRLERSRFKLSAASVEEIFDADTAESKRFLDSLIDFAKLPIDFDEAIVLIREAQQDRKQGRVVVPQLRLSDPAWAPWDVKTAQKRYMLREGMVENDDGEIIRKKPKSMAEMVADAKAVREAAAKEQALMAEAEETMISEDDSGMQATDDAQNPPGSRRGGRSDSQARRVWERHEELRREREQREQDEDRAALPPLDMTDPLQALAASMFTSVNGSGARAKGRPPGMNGRRRSGSPRQYQRREDSEDIDMEDDY